MLQPWRFVKGPFFCDCLTSSAKAIAVNYPGRLHLNSKLRDVNLVPCICSDRSTAYSNRMPVMIVGIMLMDGPSGEKRPKGSSSHV